MTTIQIDSKTVVCPTRMDAYVPGRNTLHIPIDGEAIIETSNNQDSYGEKNTPREMVWDYLPASDIRWTHTTGTLKALEGQSVVLDATDHFGYTTTQNIKVVDVNIEWAAEVGTTSWFNVTLTYIHR